jgi:hypothetical protein
MQAFEVAARHENRIALRRRWMQSRRGDYRQGHLTNPGFAIKPIDFTSMFTEFTFLEIF